jgi:hypothetical protein
MTDWIGMQKISAEEKIRRQLRDYFVYAHGKYPEDSIEVETAITTFVEMEKHLIRQIEVYQNYIEEFCNKTISPLSLPIDKRKDL